MGKAGRLHGCLVRCALLTLASICPSSIASPKSSQLIDLGLNQLEHGQPQEALKSFTEATRDDPSDSEAAFFAGVALNRLGRAEEAFAQLSAAKQLGLNHPDLPFEMGWSLLALRRWDEAIEQLNQYESQHPGRGQTAEFLGRAHLGLGKYKEADAAFAEALKRDPDLLPTVSLYRALLRQRQGDEAAARNEIYTILRTPDTTLRQLIGTQLQPLPQRDDRRWSLSLRTAVGYNTDARGVADLAPVTLVPSLPGVPPTVVNTPIPRESSAFARIGLDADYAIIHHQSDRLSVGYDLLADSYARQETDPDVFDQYAWLEYWRMLGSRFSTTLRIAENYTFVSDDKFRDELSGQISFAWRILPNFATEASYRFAYDDYRYDRTKTTNNVTVETIDRDGQAHTLSIAAELALPKQNARVRGGYLRTWNFAQDDDFDYHSDGLFASLTCALPWKITGEAFYIHTFDRYDDPNSATESTEAGAPPPYRRKDDVDGLTLRLIRPLSPHIHIYLEYNFNHDDSNISGYDYEQHITSGGLFWQF